MNPPDDLRPGADAANKPLPDSERMALGGAGAVRGYPLDEAGADIEVVVVPHHLRSRAVIRPRLAITFEQRGCIYCREMHEKILADPEVRDYISENFMVVQYNMFGDEEVTDLDGEALTEKTAARKWGYVFTPTIVFLPEDVPESKTVAEAAVSTMPGAFGKLTFLNMFKWVREKGYEGDQHFQHYHADIVNRLRAEGKLGDGED